MTHSAMRSEFEQLIDVYAPVGQLGTGFTFTEGPIWHPVDHYLLFSDMPADVRRRWDARGGVREVRASVEQAQRHDLRRRPQPDRLRARDLEPGARAAGRAARGARLAFRGHAS